MTGPLTGLRVLEVGDLGEVAGKLLADAGADVIRVEPPSGARTRHTGPFVGDEPGVNRSLHFAYLNTNKLGIVLDLRRGEAVEIWRRLVSRADVVIDAAGPGVLDTLGAGYSDVADSDRVIWCSITPFGLTGPWRDRVTTDLVSMALGGVVMMCGYDDHSLPPVRPDGEHSLAMGGEYAAIGVMAALLQRHWRGQGQHIDVSIHEAVAGTTEGAFMNWEYMGRNPERKTGRHAGTPQEWQVQCSDGGYVVAFGGGVPRTRRELQGLLDWTRECGYQAAEELADPRYEQLIGMPFDQGDDLRSSFSGTMLRFLASRSTEEVYRRGQELGLAWAPVRRPEENLDDPHWEDRGFWVAGSVPGFAGTVRYPRAGYRFLGTPVEFRRPAPDLGEHTREVLEQDLAYSSDEVRALIAEGVVAARGVE